jgi:hypothetical protein
MLTAKVPEASTACQVRDVRARQTMICGGSADSEVKEFTVPPCGPSGASAVTTVTPVANVPQTARKASGSGPVARDSSGGAETLIVELPLLDTPFRVRGFVYGTSGNGANSRSLPVIPGGELFPNAPADRVRVIPGGYLRRPCAYHRTVVFRGPLPYIRRRAHIGTWPAGRRRRSRP